jgi:hypothetical protein
MQKCLGTAGALPFGLVIEGSAVVAGADTLFRRPPPIVRLPGNLAQASALIVSDRNGNYNSCHG